MEIVQLKNGTSEPRAIVVTTMAMLRHLLTPKGSILDVLLFYELTMKSRDPNHRIEFQDHVKALQELGLLDATEQVPTSIANVVRSAVVGEGLHMTLGNPLAGTA